MPRLIDYADRFDGIRQAAYAIARDQGVEAISLDAVAEYLCLSPRTVRRLVASVDALPHLAAQWAERQQRNRFFRRDGYASWDSLSAAEHAIETLLEELPDHPKAVDRGVWWRLVLTHAGQDWARAARAEKEAVLVDLCTDAVGDIDGEDVSPLEARRLRLLVLRLMVSGAIAQICLGMMSHDDAAQAVRAHLERIPDRRAPSGDAA